MKADIEALRAEFAEYLTSEEQQESDVDVATLAKVLGMSISRARVKMLEIAEAHPERYSLVWVRKGQGGKGRALRLKG